ncbi:MAG: T9SS type A sorting domain-containing protein [Candidatus Aegiribacteria sp.]|nr:T9SS type A sorting domain-containing protein [Candidatus Aegiribacteria sp.]
MKYVVLSLLSVSLLFATEYVDGELLGNPEGTDYIEASGHSIETLSDMGPIGSTYLSPIQRAILREDEGSALWPDQDWDDDIEVYPGAVGSGQDFDIDEDTGDIYAVLDTDHDGPTVPDSIIVYRSQDGGANWSYYASEASTFGEINNPKIRVVKDGSGDTWVVILGIWRNCPAGDEPWTKLYPVAGGTALWNQVLAGDVSCVDMDADVGSGAYIYVTYTMSGTDDVRVARNLLNGGGWVGDANIHAASGITNNRAAIAAGASGNVSVAFLYDTASQVPSIRIKRSTNNGASWIPSEEVEPPGSWDDLDDIDIAYSHGSTQTGWITVTFELTLTDNFGYFLSTDSGLNWSWESLFSSGSEENHGSIRAHKTTGSLTVAYNQDPGDSTMFSWASSSTPTDFSTPVKINDFVATGYWPAAAGWNGSGYSAVLYTTYAGSTYSLWFDWFGNVGIDGTSAGLDMIRNAPNPFSATTNISFSLAQSSPVTISIYNVAGQLVRTLADNQSFNEGSHSMQWDGQNFSGTSVSPGVYFCRLSADGISQTHRMLMLR